MMINKNPYGFEDWETVKAEFLKNPKVYKEYKKLEPRYKVISAMMAPG